MRISPTTLSTERLIFILESINQTAIDNDGGRPGDHIAGVCREAARRLRLLTDIKWRLEAKPNCPGIIEFDPNVVDLEELIGIESSGC